MYVAYHWCRMYWQQQCERAHQHRHGNVAWTTFHCNCEQKIPYKYTKKNTKCNANVIVISAELSPNIGASLATMTGNYNYKLYLDITKCNFLYNLGLDHSNNLNKFTRKISLLLPKSHKSIRAYHTNSNLRRKNAHLHAIF